MSDSPPPFLAPAPAAGPAGRLQRPRADRDRHSRPGDLRAALPARAGRLHPQRRRQPHRRPRHPGRRRLAAQRQPGPDGHHRRHRQHDPVLSGCGRGRRRHLYQSLAGHPAAGRGHQSGGARGHQPGTTQPQLPQLRPGRHAEGFSAQAVALQVCSGKGSLLVANETIHYLYAATDSLLCLAFQSHFDSL